MYITYQRGNNSERYIQELTKDKFSLIFVDRYDLYESKIITSLLTDLAKEAIVLVDIKHPTFGEYKIADIDFVQIGRVLVYDNDIRRFREVEDKRLALENG